MGKLGYQSEKGLERLNTDDIEPLTVEHPKLRDMKGI